MAVYDVAIIGAGAAGIGAAKRVRELGLSYTVLEASHRIGGRGYTEETAPGEFFDLGCHWLHSASLNPFVPIAERLGFEYVKQYPWSYKPFLGGRWASESEVKECEEFIDANEARMTEAARSGADVAQVDVTEREHRWTPLLDYWVSLLTSVDADQVSVFDHAHHNDTDENWQVKDGYGRLIARFAEDIPVQLNSAVERVKWGGPRVSLETKKGTISARAAIVTVSNGILNAHSIRFEPELPDWKQEAIAALPLGNYNYICLVYDRDSFGVDHDYCTWMTNDEVPLGLQIRPFGRNQVIATTGGRFATWLERAGTEASADYVKERVANIFGGDAIKHVVRANVSAWGSDPWIKGAYSAALPGQGHQRAILAKPIDDRVFFAGEATSTEFFATAHGAYLSGIRAADEVNRNKAYGQQG